MNDEDYKSYLGLVDTYHVINGDISSLEEILDINNIFLKVIDNQSNWILGISAGTLILIFNNISNFLIKINENQSYIPNSQLLSLTIIILILPTALFGYIKYSIFALKNTSDFIKKDLMTFNYLKKFDPMSEGGYQFSKEDRDLIRNKDKILSSNKLMDIEKDIRSQWNKIKIMIKLVKLGLFLLIIGLICYGFYILNLLSIYNVDTI
jgi:hypothetical protein